MDTPDEDRGMVLTMTTESKGRFSNVSDRLEVVGRCQALRTTGIVLASTERRLMIMQDAMFWE